MALNRKAIFLFLLISCSFSWLTGLAIHLLNKAGSLDKTGYALLAFVFMLGPSVGAVVCQKFILKRGLKELGFHFQRKTWKWAGHSILFVFVTLVLTTIIIILFGNNSYFGKFELSAAELLKSAGNSIPPDKRAEVEDALKLVPPLLLFGVMLTAGILAGAILNTPLMLSEELGWRGFLFVHFPKRNFIVAALITGTIWGLWHWPLIVMGHNYGEKGIWGVLMMTLFCISGAFPFHYFRLRSGNLLAPCMLHGIINGSAATISVFNSTADPLFGSYAGVAGILALNLTFWPVYFMDRKNITHESHVQSAE